MPIFPLLAALLLYLLLRRFLGPMNAFVCAAVSWGVLLLFMTELLSLGHMITRAGVGTAWAIAVLASGGMLRAPRQPRTPRTGPPLYATWLGPVPGRIDPRGHAGDRPGGASQQHGRADVPPGARRPVDPARKRACLRDKRHAPDLHVALGGDIDPASSGSRRGDGSPGPRRRVARLRGLPGGWCRDRSSSRCECRGRGTLGRTDGVAADGHARRSQLDADGPGHRVGLWRWPGWPSRSPIGIPGASSCRGALGLAIASKGTAYVICAPLVALLLLRRLRATSVRAAPRTPWRSQAPRC